MRSKLAKAGTLELRIPQYLCAGAWGQKPYSTWSPHKNTHSGKIESCSKTMERGIRDLIFCLGALNTQNKSNSNIIACNGRVLFWASAITVILDFEWRGRLKRVKSATKGVGVLAHSPLCNETVRSPSKQWSTVKTPYLESRLNLSSIK